MAETKTQPQPQPQKKTGTHAPAEEVLARHGFVAPTARPETVQINIPASALTNVAAKSPLQQYQAGAMATATGATYQKGRHRIVVQDDGSWVHIDRAQAVSNGDPADLEPYLREHQLGEANASSPAEKESHQASLDVLRKHQFAGPSVVDGQTHTLHGHEVTLDQAGNWTAKQDGKDVGKGTPAELEPHLHRHAKKEPAKPNA